MIAFSAGGIPVRVSFWFPVMLMTMLAWGEENITLHCLAASLLHECGHFAMMLWVRDRPDRVCLGVFGVRVERKRESAIGYTAQAAISFAGPLTNLFCAAVLYGLHGGGDGVWIHTALGLFNLLPIEGLDGGEGVYRLLCCFCRETTAHAVARVLSVALLLPLTSMGFYLLFQGGGNPSLLILSVYLIFLLIFKEKH